jgi:hypothetical protein
MASKPLPEGWRIVSLHYGDDRDPTIVPVRGRITDAKIAAADAIRVSYTNKRNGVVTYRTIHGASSKTKVGDLIRNVTRVVSPV